MVILRVGLKNGSVESGKLTFHLVPASYSFFLPFFYNIKLTQINTHLHSRDSRAWEVASEK